MESYTNIFELGEKLATLSEWGLTFLFIGVVFLAPLVVIAYLIKKAIEMVCGND